MQRVSKKGSSWSRALQGEMVDITVSSVLGGEEGNMASAKRLRPYFAVLSFLGLIY